WLRYRPGDRGQWRVSDALRIQARYCGLFPAVPTTFAEDGELDIESQRRCVDLMSTRHTSSVMVNLPTASVDYHVPIGGRKGSGNGPREQGVYATVFYTVVKIACITT